MLSEDDRQKAIQACVQIQARSVEATSTLESRLALLERQLADKLRLLEELRNEKAHLRRPVCKPPVGTQPRLKTEDATCTPLQRPALCALHTSKQGDLLTLYTTRHDETI